MKAWVRVAFVLSWSSIMCVTLWGQDSPQPGLATVMFENIEFKRPTGLEVMPQVNVDTGLKVNDYSRIWIGQIRSPIDGQVDIFTEADDGLRLSIGGKKI